MWSLVQHLVRPRVLITCLFLLALGFLAACGITLGPGQQAPSCGTLILSLGPQAQQYAANYDGQRVKAIEQCFVQAYHQCKAMSLLVTEHGVDTGTHYTYTITPQGSSCQIIETSQGYSANFGGSEGPVMTSTCGGLAVNQDTLVIEQCPGQEVTIPRGEECGSVYPQATQASVKVAEDCFAEDYQQCYPASLYYDAGNEVYNDLRISASCQLALVQQGTLPGTPCASLTQQADGLHVLGCGNQGDILVPANP